MSTDTVLVMESILSAFRDVLLSLLQDPATKGTFISSVVTPKSAARIEALLSDAGSKGAKLYTASEIPTKLLVNGDTSQEYIARISPTIIENMTPNMDLYTQESFGPLLSLTRIQSENEAVKIMNECRYGLSAAIFTKDHYKAIFMAKRLRVGAIHVNGATVHDESTLPHGGHGDSGWGRFGATWGLAEFVQTKTVILNR
jgi:acyl-CoA reductase-like NAD-dependent aldehyde dehydrogenase